MAIPTNQAAGDTDAATARDGIWLFRGAVLLLFLDILVSTLLMSPILSWVRHHQENESSSSSNHHYALDGSLLDLLLLSGCRVVTASVAFAISFLRGRVREEYPFDVLHPNGKKKTRDELEEEALQQSFGTWFCRYVNRAAFPSEIFCLVTTLLAVVKTLIRLNTEIGVLKDAEPVHPIFWICFSFAATISVIEMMHVDNVCLCLGKWGSAAEKPSILRRISSHLSVPLLANENSEEQGEVDNEHSEEQTSNDQGQSTAQDDEHAPGDSGIEGDTDYKASFSDLLQLCAPDSFLIGVAFIFLLLAAMMQIYIPKYTGACLDALEQAYSSNDDGNINNNDHESINDIPGFISNVKKLIIVSALSGFFSGLRGSIFTMVGGRVNVRLRLRLMDSLLTMEQGFFDLTKTGNITSRLSSDTTLVGDQVTLNVNVSMNLLYPHHTRFILLFIDRKKLEVALNPPFFFHCIDDQVFLRSLVQIIGVLIFMFMLSWQLSMLAFISVPVITILSRWYGNFVRSLTKVMQTKLAEGNSVSEAAISSMPTIRAFDAAPTEYEEFKGYMDEVRKRGH